MVFGAMEVLEMRRNQMRLRKVVGYIHPTGVVFLEDDPGMEGDPDYMDREPPAGYEDMLYEEARDLEFYRQHQDQNRQDEAAP